jgi:predicted nucleotidyltransferase/HEPN domain-containing protein
MPDRALAGKPPSADNTILDEVARRLVETCHPDRIYLFGSAARGEAGVDSDYDFLLVVPDDTPRDVLSGRRPHQAVSDLGLFTDMVVYTRTYFGERLHLVSSMPATVVREGRLLYHSGEDGWIVDPVDKTIDTAQWMGKARSDLRTTEALLALTPPEVGNALYHCQQAAEKAMKALLYWQDVPFHKTHELEKLGKDCVDRDPALGPLFSRAKSLSEYVYLFRYPGVDDPKLEQGRIALALAREVYEAVAQRLPPEAIGP